MEIGGNIGNILNSKNVDGFMNTMDEVIKKNSDIGLALMSKAPMYVMCYQKQWAKHIIHERSNCSRKSIFEISILLTHFLLEVNRKQKM